MEGEELQEKIEQLRQNRGGRSPAGERRSREPDFRRAYRGEREPARGAFSWQEDVSARYGAPADEKREDGLLGVFTFQGILAVTVALLYVLAAALAPEISSGALAEFRNRSENDFSFREQVYDTVGNLLSYLNEAHPVSGEMDGESLDGMGGEPALSSRELPDNATFAPLVYTGKVADYLGLRLPGASGQRGGGLPSGSGYCRSPGDPGAGRCGRNCDGQRGKRPPGEASDHRSREWICHGVRPLRSADCPARGPDP